MAGFKTVVVALDGSMLADEVVTSIGRLHLEANAKAVLMQVLPPKNHDTEVDVTLPSPSGGEAYAQIERRLVHYQSQLQPLETQFEIVSGDPAEEIIRLANIHQADLIVLGSRGLTGVNRILQHSVSSQVVEDAPCSVMVVRPKSQNS